MGQASRSPHWRGTVRQADHAVPAICSKRIAAATNSKPFSTSPKKEPRLSGVILLAQITANDGLCIEKVRGFRPAFLSAVVKFNDN